MNMLVKPGLVAIYNFCIVTRLPPRSQLADISF